MIGACQRAWRCHYVALALSWTVRYDDGRSYRNMYKILDMVGQ
jgi:hypothetical protein